MEEPEYTLLDRQDISTLIFYPRSEWYSPPPGATDHMVPVSDQIVVSCRYYRCDTEAPSILFFHGNGEIACDYDDLAPFYVNNHLNLFVADYRGYGASSGGPQFSTIVSDAQVLSENRVRRFRPSGTVTIVVKLNMGYRKYQ